MPVIEGREFDVSDRSGAVEVALVNDAFIRRFWPDRRQAVGRHIGVGFPETRTVEVVGVVGDFKNRTLGDVARPMVFTSRPFDTVRVFGVTDRCAPPRPVSGRPSTRSARRV